MAIEIRQTKRAIVYRAVVSTGAPGSPKISKTFRTKAAAQSWEQEVLQAARESLESAPSPRVSTTSACPARADRGTRG
jgi:hypothetical protein